METDLDKAELLKLRAGELCGDRLLNTYYVSTVSPPIYRKRKPHDSVAAIEEVLQRPVTPSQLKGGDAPIVHIQPRARNGAHSSLRNSSRQNSRPSSRDLVRPPTRCGSSNGTTPRVATDNQGSELVGKALGQTRTLAMGTDSKSVKPSPKAMQKVNTNGAIVEYQAAFSSRPRIARTPDGGRPTSRGSVGEGPLPQPKYSDSLPTPRPSSGGRSSSESLCVNVYIILSCELS
ncbi:hypothetical protein NP493_733g00021 [Ridgeia piscesae]|uniref:Uncharacterized protein n=1 Tax=Ridgeia piscesae TaxID=27915 RepID=A0AAD9KQ07_RIDPI|nr:hypothetical protein NP493_733g00021 [Ridgeia piscesae]